MSENAEPIGGLGGLAGIGLTERTAPFRQSSYARQNELTGKTEPERQASGFAAQAGDSLQLSPEARQQLQELKARDAEVRAHERAHMAAAGEHAVGGPQYDYQTGPDGRQYAIGGQVNIDTSAVPGDPEASEEKARQVRRAALAPGQPSAQDMQVAAEASRLENQSRMDGREEGEGEQGEIPDNPLEAMRRRAEDPAVGALAAGPNASVLAASVQGAMLLASPDASEAAALDGAAAMPSRRQALQAYETASLGSPAVAKMPRAAMPSGEGGSLRNTIDGIMAAYSGSGGLPIRQQAEAAAGSSLGVSPQRAARAYAGVMEAGGAFAADSAWSERLVACVA
ncbi:MAG TPA: catalase [Candidatus Desulfovibrio intestinavium]|uniref:Catalase n=1 Tax=Candidatus Desulfovibrio intestinavium TaxID=2838534 RepID=A0A9D2HQ11_9BACT|nr:catalase [Candidatus Desulfovibrio intestinavium]